MRFPQGRADGRGQVLEELGTPSLRSSRHSQPTPAPRCSAPCLLPGDFHTASHTLLCLSLPSLWSGAAMQRGQEKPRRVPVTPWPIQPSTRWVRGARLCPSFGMARAAPGAAQECIFPTWLETAPGGAALICPPQSTPWLPQHHTPCQAGASPEGQTPPSRHPACSSTRQLMPCHRPGTSHALLPRERKKITTSLLSLPELCPFLRQSNEEATCLLALNAPVPSHCARRQLTRQGVCTTAGDEGTEPAPSPTCKGARVIRRKRFPQGWHATINSPQPGQPPCPQATRSSPPAHLALFHPCCPQLTRSSCSLCPLIPDRLKSKTRQRFIK